jgi:hypothetical protein
MREALSNKFNGISHKWLKFELDDEVFKKIKTKLKESLEADLYNEKDLRKILKHFKRKDFCWVKYLSCRGTSFMKFYMHKCLMEHQKDLSYSRLIKKS